VKKIIVIGLLIVSAPLLGALQQYAGKTFPKTYTPSYNFSSYNKFNTPNYNYPNYTNITPTTNNRNYSWFTQQPVPSPSEQQRIYNEKYRKFLNQGGQEPSATIIIPQKSLYQRIYEYFYGTPESKVDLSLFPGSKEAPTFKPYLNKKQNDSWW